jgi:hypothetical protein
LSRYLATNQEDFWFDDCFFSSFLSFFLLYVCFNDDKEKEKLFFAKEKDVGCELEKKKKNHRKQKGVDKRSFHVCWLSNFFFEGIQRWQCVSKR